MSEDLKYEIGSILMDDEPGADNLSIALCTYFSNHIDRPEDDPEDTESGWGEWIIQRCEETLDKIVAVCKKEAP